MIARLLFSSLLSSLLGKVDSELTKKDAAEMMKKINSSLSNMLTTSTQFYAPFIACLLVCTTLFLASHYSPAHSSTLRSLPVSLYVPRCFLHLITVKHTQFYAPFIACLLVCTMLFLASHYSPARSSTLRSLPASLYVPRCFLHLFACTRAVSPLFSQFS